MNLDRKKLKKIKDDASFRCFYRKKSNKKNSIIVYANKEKEKNLLIYDAVNNLLINLILKILLAGAAIPSNNLNKRSLKWIYRTKRQHVNQYDRSILVPK